MGIGSQGPEALVNDLVLVAVEAYFAIVVGVGVEPILKDGGFDSGGPV
jgi:hypothetical protein